MTTNNRIQVSELDYNQIRENLKTFLRGQEKFSDYDFEGSALSTLIDVLAYNTHYNALYTNLAVNEMFLDSASKRNSVVSIANNFGYTPKSAVTSTARLNVLLTQQNATNNTMYIPKLSSFQASVDNVQYAFYTLEDYVADRVGNTYTFNNVDIYEGVPQTSLFVCTEANQRFTLPNTNIDIDTITVTVQQTGEKPDYVKYERATDVLHVALDSKIYFIKELEDGLYQIYFGSGGIGTPIQTGNIITVQYMVSNKDLANGASTFIYTGQGLGGVVSCLTVNPSYGGKTEETIDQIKYNVSQAFFDQNRAVTPGDYVALIKRYYPNIDSISVWGGEDNDPPQYGKVFISMKPSTGPYLTPTEKAYIVEKVLKPNNVVSVTPEILDPSYMEMEISCTVYYNKTKTTRSIDDIKNSVISAITKYREDNLQKFDGVFRMSRFQSAIDNCDQSIVSNVTTHKLYCEITPKYNILADYKLNIVNPIYNERVPEEAFKSTGFYLDNTTTVYYLDDDGLGNIRVYSIVEGTGEKIIKHDSVGTVNYNTGLISIKGLRITNLVDPNFYFIIKTSSYDVVSIRSQIVDIPDTRITVNVIQDVSSSGSYAGGTNYQFTSSRN